MGGADRQPRLCAARILVAGERMTTKETVLAVLDRLPDDCTLDDVQYHLYVTQAIAAGLKDSNAGRVILHAQVEAEIRRKWLIGSEK